MAQQVQLRRGTTANHSSFTGVSGEVTVDTSLNTLRVHDGSTVGGTVLAKTANPIFTGNTATANLAATGVLSVNGPAYATIGTLTDGATITPDFGTYNNFTVTLGGNRTLANPTNLVAGQSGVIYIVQDGTGSRTLSYGANWKFPSATAPTLTTTANAVDVLVYAVRSTSYIAAQLLTNVG